MADLFQKIQKLWFDITLQYGQSLYNSFPRRIIQVIRLKGHLWKYLVSLLKFSYVSMLLLIRWFVTACTEWHFLRVVFIVFVETGRRFNEYFLHDSVCMCDCKKLGVNPSKGYLFRIVNEGSRVLGQSVYWVLRLRLCTCTWGLWILMTGMRYIVLGRAV